MNTHRASLAAACLASLLLLAPFCAAVNTINAVKYTGVGGTGSYQQVSAMQCSSASVGTCPRKTVNVSGNLAPFNDDISLVFRGPMNIYHLSVYQPAGNAQNANWQRVSQYNPGQTPNNLVFLSNTGGGPSGVFDYCFGSSQAYANNDFSGAAASAAGQKPNGHLADGKEVNIMSGVGCNSTTTCPGYARGVGQKGWAGSKLFVMTFDMPPGGGNDLPAIWALNGQVLRSAQYNCNCRGMGAAGGCGELDLLEVIAKGQGPISQIYSFKGSTGTGNNNAFARPTNGKVTYAVLFDVNTDQIAIQKWNSFNTNTAAFNRAQIDTFLKANALLIPFK